MFFKIPDWLRHEIRELWSRLAARLGPARRWINLNPKIIIVITAVSVFIFLPILIWFICTLIPEKPLVEVGLSDKAWFYDLNTEQLFVGRDDQIPPIEAPSGPLPNGGPAGVKAYVLSYVDEPNESERFIAFLETSVPKAIMERLESTKPKTNDAKPWGYGKLIRRLNDKKWVPANSYQGRSIMERIFRPNKTGESARYCPPE